MRLLLMIFSALMLLCSCKNDSYDLVVGQWDPCKISVENAQVTKKDGSYYIDVPASGAMFNVKVTNYSGWTISTIAIRTNENDDFKLIYYGNITYRGTKDKDWYDFTVDKEKLNCSIKPNPLATERTVRLGMSAGDSACDIYIHQSEK